MKIIIRTIWAELCSPTPLMVLLVAEMVLTWVLGDEYDRRLKLYFIETKSLFFLV